MKSPLNPHEITKSPWKLWYPMPCHQAAPQAWRHKPPRRSQHPGRRSRCSSGSTCLVGEWASQLIIPTKSLEKYGKFADILLGYPQKLGIIPINHPNKNWDIPKTWDGIWFENPASQQVARFQGFCVAVPFRLLGSANSNAPFEDPEIQKEHETNSRNGI